MQQTRDRDDEAEDVGAAFADPAFAGPKARNAPFAILRPAAGEVAWANAAAAAFWGADAAAELAEALFGIDGRGGWLDGLTRGLVTGRPPRLSRAGLARGFRMRAHTALIRAWTGRDGATLIGLAVSDAGSDEGVTAAPDADAWRRPAWAPAATPAEGPAEEPGLPSVPAPSEAVPDAGDGRREDGGDGPALAERGRLAVLRDRLSRALDGAATLRMLWRTDAAGAVTAADARALARLGSPLRFDGAESGALFDAVAPFDPAGAGRLRAALAARATFAGLSFDLPVADAAATVPLVLSGSPVFGPERAFAGFRGFGIVDLGRLAPADRRAPAAESTADLGEEAVAGAGATRAADGAGAAADGRQAADVPPAAPAPPEPAVTGPLVPEPAVEAPPRAEREPPANVVQLRAFQGSASGRFGAVPSSPRPETVDAEAREAAAAEPPVEPAAEAQAREDGPLSDQLAFLALGEALRARIGEAFPAAGPAGTDAPPAPGIPPSPEAEPASAASGEPASALLDRLPIPVLATVDGRAVFANPAAAARLGYADAPALLAAGVDARGEPGGRIALTGASGETVSAAARRAEVPWAGTFATLWLLAEPEDVSAPLDGGSDETRVEAFAPADADDRSVELLDRVDDAVALLDAAGRLRRLNRRGEGWFGRRDPEVPPSQGLAELLVPESRPAALALLNEVRNQRDGLGAPPLRREVVARTADGAAVPMLLTAGRLGASGFYATLRDVSALQRAEIDRARTERDHARAAGRLPDLLAKVSHEIRTPLGAILGFAEVMMDERFGPLGNPRYKDYLKDIHASGAQVVALVEDLLDLSRIEAGQLDLDVAAVDINRVVTEAVAQMQPEAHRERVIMRTSLAGRIPSVLADERSARQIVKNLLSNAVKFNEPGGQVIVSTAPGEGDGVLLRVRDTGVGMSDEAIAAALEPFGGLPARAPAGGDGAGNGLGLPLTRALVGANGASMTIRSRPREGTLVEVSFAAAEEGGARRPA